MGEGGKVQENVQERNVEEARTWEQADPACRRMLRNGQHFYADRAAERARSSAVLLCLLFVYYEKAFDSIKLSAVMRILVEKWID